MEANLKPKTSKHLTLLFPLKLSLFTLKVREQNFFLTNFFDRAELSFLSAHENSFQSILDMEVSHEKL
jgi:hypothetical protein